MEDSSRQLEAERGGAPGAAAGNVLSRVTCHVSRAPPGEGHVEDVLVVAAGHQDGEADGQQRRPGAGAAPGPGYSQHRGMGPGYFYVVYIFYLVMHFIFCVTIEVWQKVRKVVIDSAVKASGVVYIKHKHVVQYTHITIINS